MSRSPNARRLVPCMPPLLEEETKPLSRSDGFTKFGGTACENIVKSYFLANNVNVAEPHVDDGVDLLIEKPEGWVRGQVKKVVYQNELDKGMFKRHGIKIYRPRFDFNFQGSGCYSKEYSEKVGVKHRRQRRPGEIDYFYHVLLTPYRELIWETPASLIPLREDGTFIQGKNQRIDSDNWIRKKSQIDFSKYLISSKYSPIVIKSYPNFFLKPEQPTLEKFLI